MALVFISHSSRDQEQAQQLINWLHSIGLANVFLDFDKHSGFGAGSDWERTLYQEIERCQAMMIVVTPAWLESKWCFVEFTQARALGKAIFPVIMSPIGERFIGGDIQAVDITREGEGGLEKLGRSLIDVALHAQGGFTWDKRRSPYPGLLPFEEEDAAVYFGRDDEIRRIIERMNVRRVQGGPRVLALLAASGTGKSSLLRAGLLPRLKRDNQTWIVVPPMRPGRNPANELARVLSTALGDEARWPDLRDGFRGQGCHETLRKYSEELRSRLRAFQAFIVLSIDQAEELFTVSAPEEAAEFFEILSTLSSKDLPFISILSMRSDFLSALQVASGLHAPFEEISIRPLPLERIGEIIRGPAKVAGIEIDDRIVPLAMRQAATSDALPLLAFAMRELWESFGAQKVLSLAAYESLGDANIGLNPLENAVRRSADAALEAANASDAEIEALKRAFVPAMVRVNEQGEYARQAAVLTDLPPESRRLIDELARARLLVVRQVEGQQEVEVAHEALLRKWPRVKDWLDAERDFIVGKGQLKNALGAFQTAKEDDKQDALLQGLLLSRARQWLAQHPYALSAEEKDFIQLSADQADSEERRKRNLRLAITWGSAACAVVFAAISLVAYQQWRNSEANRALSQHNLGLALLDQAETHLKEDRPTNAFVTASIATGHANIAGQSEPLSFLDASSEAYLKAQTIAKTTGAAALIPKATIKAVGAVTAVALTQDGAKLAFAARDNTISLIDAATMSVLSRFAGPKDRINAVRFSADGKLLVAGARDHSVTVIDLATGEAASLCAHTGGVDDIDIDPKSRWIASAGRDGLVQVWHVATRSALKSLPGAVGAAQAVRFNGDGSRLAYGDQQGNVFVVDTATWTEVAHLVQPEKDIVSVAFHPDGVVLVTATYDSVVNLWSIPDKAKLKTFTAHGDKLWRMTLTPEGHIATASFDHTVRIRDAKSLQLLSTVDGHDEWVTDLAFAGPALLVTGSEDGYVRLWDIAAVEPMFPNVSAYSADVLKAAFSRDGRTFAAGSLAGEAIAFAVDERRRITQRCPAVRHPYWVNGIDLTSDGRVMASVGAKDGASDNAIVISDTETCQELARIPLGPVVVKSLGISRDDKLLVGAGGDGSVRLYDLKTGVTVKTLSGHSGPVEAVTFDPSGEFMASVGSQDRQIIIWRVADGSLYRQMPGLPADVWFIKFSPDGRYLASSGNERVTRLWDWRNGRLATDAITMPATAAGLQFTTDSRILVVGDDNRGLTAWQLEPLQRVDLLTGPVGLRGPIASHPQSPIIAFEAGNGKVDFWDLGRKIRAAPAESSALDGTQVKFRHADSGALQAAKPASIPASCK